jgi:hypothetical protein
MLIRDVLSKTASPIEPTGEHVAYVAGDVDKPETIQHLVPTTVARFGGIAAHLFDQADVCAALVLRIL